MQVIETLFNRLLQVSLMQVEITRSMAPLSTNGTFEIQ